MHTPIPVWRHFAKQARAQINVLRGAALASINNCRVMGLARGRVEDVDGGAASGVGVGIGRVIHHGNGEGDNGIGVAALDPAGAHPRAVVGHVAHVTESDAVADEEEGRKDGE